MRILLLCASGNTSGCTYSLCSVFSQECVARGHDAEIIDLSGIDIADCNGCKSCNTSGECVISDGAEELFKRMESVDLLVLATPLRFNGVSSIMKRFVDRLNPYWFSDRRHPGQVCGIICGGSPEPTFVHAISEMKSAAAALKSGWAGVLSVGGTDMGGCGTEQIRVFAESILSSL